MTDLTREELRQLRDRGGPTDEEFLTLLDMAERTAESVEELAARREVYRTCVAADEADAPCPIHGSCACVYSDDGHGQWHGPDVSACPLHSAASTHAAPPFEDAAESLTRKNGGG